MSLLNIAEPFMLFLAVVINAVIGAIAYKTKLVNRSGLISGIVVGILIFAVYGWQGFLLLFAFFFAGSMATRHKNDVKEKLGVAQKNKGARSIIQVLSNLSVPIILAISLMFAADYGQVALVYHAAFAATLAAALGDTLATEMGQVYGRKCYLLITMERVRVGTEGAVSLQGSLWGLGGIFLISVLALALGMFAVDPYKNGLLILFAAVIANLVESILGGVLNQFGKSGNGIMMNLTNTAVAAGLCFFFLQ